MAAAAEVAKAQKQAAAREKAAAAKQKEAAADVAAAKQETAEVKRAAAADMEYYEGERKKAREEGVARERQLEQAKASEAAIGVRLANALVTVRTLEQRLLRVEAERDAAVRRVSVVRLIGSLQQM